MKIDYDFKMMSDNDLFTSIFNINDKEIKKANKAFYTIYGNKKFQQLQKFIKKGGIMAIFNVIPTDELFIYALLLTQAQNQRR